MNCGTFEIARAMRVGAGDRFCDHCSEPLTGDVLLAQAAELMKPFRDRPLREVKDQVVDLVKRAATPLNEGADCCYLCAFAISKGAG